MILRSFYNAFSIASKHDFDDQFFLLATVPNYFPDHTSSDKRFVNYNVFLIFYIYIKLCHFKNYPLNDFNNSSVFIFNF
jgi:hypothetical protein